MMKKVIRVQRADAYNFSDILLLKPPFSVDTAQRCDVHSDVVIIITLHSETCAMHFGSFWMSSRRAWKIMAVRRYRIFMLLCTCNTGMYM